MDFVDADVLTSFLNKLCLIMNINDIFAKAAKQLNQAFCSIYGSV